MPETAVVTIPLVPGATHGLSAPHAAEETPAAPPAEGEQSTTPAPAAADTSKTEEPKPQTPAEKTASAKILELAKRERGVLSAVKKLNESKESFKAEQAKALAAIEAERAKVAADVKAAQEFAAYKAKAKANPEAAAKALWGDAWYDALTEYKVKGAVPADLAAAALDDKLEQFKAEQAKSADEARKAAEEKAAAETKSAAEAKAAADAKAKAAWVEGVKAFVITNAADYELIELNGAHGYVSDLIEQEFLALQKRAADGDEAAIAQMKVKPLLTNKEAADRVEEFLVNQARKLVAATKLQASVQTPPQASKPPPKTLSNDIRASTPGAQPPPKNDEERMARALKKWEELERAKK